MWTCPECGKKFRNKNQWHSCYRLEVEDHLRNKPESIQKAVRILLEKINSFGPVQLNPVKSSIQVRAGATFLSIIPKKDYVQLEFQAGREITDFPVHKTVKISGNRYYHYLFLQEPEDISTTLIDWLYESYILVKSNN